MLHLQKSKITISSEVNALCTILIITCTLSCSNLMPALTKDIDDFRLYFFIDAMIA